MHYNEVWEDMHLEQFKRQRETVQSRKKLLASLDTDTMIKIMFKDYLHKLSDFKVIELQKEYMGKEGRAGNEHRRKSI